MLSPSCLRERALGTAGTSLPGRRCPRCLQEAREHRLPFVPVSTATPRCWFWGGCRTPSVAGTSRRREGGGLRCVGLPAPWLGPPGAAVSWERWRRERGSGRLGQAATSRWQLPAAACARLSVALLAWGWKPPGAVLVPAVSPLQPVRANARSEAALGFAGDPRVPQEARQFGAGRAGAARLVMPPSGSQDPFPVPFMSLPSCVQPAGALRGGAAAGREGWQEPQCAPSRAGAGPGVRGEPPPPCSRGQAPHPVPAAGWGKAGC